jgi:type VI secretion system secreted protein VgrG
VPPSGQHDGGTESVWALKSQHNVVQQSVFTRDYNYRNAPEEMSQSADVTSGDVTTYGEAYHWADNYLAPGSDGQRNPEPESGAFYARLRHERYLNDQTRLSGRTSSAALAPGRELKVTGGAEVTEVFRQGVVITGIHSRARRDRSYEVAFTAIPFSENYGFRPQPGDRPVMAGTLPARVTSTKTNDIYGHIDRDGRYKVNLLFDRDHWQPGKRVCGYVRRAPMPGTHTACTCRCWRGRKWPSLLSRETRTVRILPVSCTTRRTRTLSPSGTISATSCGPRRTTKSASTTRVAKSTSRSARSTAARVS